MPLQSAGLLERVVPGPDFLRELYSLTRGSPYEIARLCNLLYDRLKAQNPETMVLELTDALIEEAAVQLRPAPEDEAALATLRRADDRMLTIAARYCVDPSLTQHEHALLATAFEEPTPERQRIQQERVTAEWAELEAAGLATRNRLFLAPTFGELSRLYLKYWARGSGIPVRRIEGTYAERMSDRVTDEISVSAAGVDGRAPRRA